MDQNEFLVDYSKFLDDYLHPGFNVDPNKEDFYDDFGQYIVNVHTIESCSGKCTIHYHTKHSLDDKPLLWRNDRKIFEHICDHGVGHPCPDSLPQTDNGVHGCCGCCIASTNAV